QTKVMSSACSRRALMATRTEAGHPNLGRAATDGQARPSHGRSRALQNAAPRHPTLSQAFQRATEPPSPHRPAPTTGINRASPADLSSSTA
uniref:Uncharacterized protein n=1 Tax=Aegilops tauschii subsp. strangulata TaxID=200361 RepID=A0A453NLZ2_AEGTS